MAVNSEKGYVGGSAYRQRILLESRQPHNFPETATLKVMTYILIPSLRDLALVQLLSIIGRQRIERISSRILTPEPRLFADQSRRYHLDPFLMGLCIVLGFRSLGRFSSSIIKQLFLAGQKSSQPAGNNGNRLLEKWSVWTGHNHGF